MTHSPRTPTTTEKLHRFAQKSPGDKLAAIRSTSHRTFALRKRGAPLAPSTPRVPNTRAICAREQQGKMHSLRTWRLGRSSLRPRAINEAGGLR